MMGFQSGLQDIPLGDSPKENLQRAEIRTTLSNLRSLEARVERMVEAKDSAEITITFKQKYRDTWDNDELIIYMKRYFAFMPLNLKEILLVTEYGDNMNLHFHGILRGTAKDKSTVKSYCNKRIGRTTVSTIRNTQKYKEYLLKEQTRETLKDIIYFNYEDDIERLDI